MKRYESRHTEVTAKVMDLHDPPPGVLGWRSDKAEMAYVTETVRSHKTLLFLGDYVVDLPDGRRLVLGAAEFEALFGEAEC